jgi:RNA polymerase sigma factor (sigma-70 family)
METARRVLVVDDEEVIVEGLMALLNCEAFETAGALDRESATSKISELYYPIIVADLCLRTREEGLRLLDEIRRLSPDSRVVTITGFATPELEAEVLARGASMMLTKPAEPAMLLEAIVELLGELEREAASQEVVDLETLYTSVQKVLYSIPQRKYGFSREMAEDVVQDAWMLFLEKRAYVHTARSWLAGTVSNLCLRQLDRLRRTRGLVSEDVELADIPDRKSAEADQTRLIVRQALSRIDARSRQLCNRIAIDGLSYEEVSTSMLLPLGSVGPLYIRAKKKLRKALGN